MKKDMGGAAHALALAQLIIASGCRCASTCSSRRSRMPSPAAPIGPATSSSRARACSSRSTIPMPRGGSILADALARAAEGKPELIVDFATLTGAARIALGPDLPATVRQPRRPRRGARDAPRATSKTHYGGCRCGMPTTKSQERHRRLRQRGRRRPWPAAIYAALFLQALRPGGTCRGPISTPGRGATPGNRGVPRAATRSGCARFSQCSSAVIRGMIVPSAEKSGISASLRCNISRPCRFNRQLRGTIDGDWRQ